MRWLLLGLMVLQAATCGQRGPLTLPEPPAAAVATLPAEVTTPLATGPTGAAEQR